MSTAFLPTATDAALAALAETPLHAVDKGFGGAGDGEWTPASLLAQGATLAHPVFSLPLLVLRDEALAHNIRTMADYVAGRGALFAPHGKTTMSPEVVARQLAAGAWGITAADVRQALVFQQAGARRILIANEVTDAAGIAALAQLLSDDPELTLYAYVDSVVGVGLLDEGLRSAGLAPGRRLRVLVEVGIAGGRAGVRTVAEGREVAVAAAATTTLLVAGAACFEGVVGHATDEGTLARAAAFCATVRELGEAIAADDSLGDEPDDGVALVLSAGGSHYFDVVASELSRSAVPGTAVVLRSGSYVTHDHGTYLHSSPALREAGLAPFLPAIEVHVRVLSRPEPGLVLLGVGRRDVSFDSGLPVVLAARRGRDPIAVQEVRIIELNDQHAFVEVAPDSVLAAGDVVVLGISHPCTTMDKWRHAVIADAADRVRAIAHTAF